MSLKTDYLEGPDGFRQKMQDVFDAGVAFIVTNLSAFSDELKDQASDGVSSFTFTLPVTFEPEALRLKGTHMNTFFAGLHKGLADEEIYDYEVTIALNESDTNQLQIDFDFTL